MIDLNKQNGDFAVFLPAMSPEYIRTASNPYAKRPGFNTDIFNFFDPAGAFYYPWALYSAGMPGSWNINVARDSMIYGRDRTKSKIVTDSAGFQIISGGVFNWANRRDFEDKSKKILDWQIATGDIGVIIDIPLYSIADPKQPNFNSFKACLDQTVDNIKFFQNNGMGDHPFMNAIHGRTPAECNRWYNAVKKYPLKGWAFGGEIKENMYLFLRMLLKLRDDHELDPGQDWVHVFAIERPKRAIAYSAIKRELNKSNPELELTFDAAGYATLAVRTRQMFMSYNPFGNDKLNIVKAPYKKSTHPLSTVNVFGKKIKVGQIKKFVSDCGEYFEDTYSPILSGQDSDDVVVPWATSKAGWDSVSNSLIVAHNLYVKIDAIQGANWRWKRFGHFSSEPHENHDIARLNHIIEEVFNSQKAMNCLGRNRAFLEAY